MITLGELEYVVLLAVLRVPAERRFGQEIHEELMMRIKRGTTFQSVYATLDRLQRKGFLTSKMSEPSGIRGGRSRRMYTMTLEGVRAAEDHFKMHRSMEEGLML